MHSGLGPAAHLAEFNLPVLVDIPAIGQGLRDHPFSPIAFLREPRTNTRNAFFGSQEAMDAALTQWEKNNSGPWTRYGAQLMMGFLKSEATTASEEYKALPEDVKRFLSKPTTPHFEVIAGCPLHMLAPGMTTDYSYTAVLVFLMIAQSYGEVKLQSSDPDVPLLFNPNLLAHEYDRRVVIEAMREALAITKHEAFAKDTLSTFMAPASESDEICSSGLRIRVRLRGI
jgi:choline dehydrogenase-like flavoprotein